MYDGVSGEIEIDGFDRAVSIATDKIQHHHDRLIHFLSLSFFFFLLREMFLSYL